MVAPVIGLTTYREEAAWGVWHQRADLLPTQYADAVEATGGVPVLLAPLGLHEAAEAVVARLDGLVISGGADVDPGRYDAEPHPRTAGWRPDRDAWEVALLVLGEELPEQRRVDRPGAQSVDAHSLAGELHAELA